MIEHIYKELFQQDSIHKDFEITFNGGTITNVDLHQESIDLTESICSDTELKFGRCEASVLKFTVSNIVQPLKGKWLTVKVVLNNDTANKFQIGRYKVESDKPSADRNYREIVAYDALHDLANTDVKAWYDGLLPNEQSTVTLQQFRDNLFAHLAIPHEYATLVNDSMTVKKTIDTDKLSALEVLQAICEINGAFGHINRQGFFEFVVLGPITEGLYPSDDLYPSDTLYPSAENASILLGKNYIDCQYEDFVTQPISKLQIRQEENDIGAVVGNGNNAYVVQGNFLVYGKNATELQTIANKLYSVISKITYRPYEATTKGNYCYEVGDIISITGKREIVHGYVLSRTIHGIQALRDVLSAQGTEYYTETTNSLQTQITQLQGKTNKLTRTVDETRSEISDVESGLQSQITQTASSIRAEVEDIESGLQSQINVQAGQIQLRTTQGEVNNMINVAIDGIELTADKINLNGYTTVNGNFSIDNDGNMQIKSGDSQLFMSGGVLNIKHTNDDDRLVITPTSIALTNAEATGTLLFLRVMNGGFYVGDSNHPFRINATTFTVNGSTAITSANIGSYIPSISGLENDLNVLRNTVSGLQNLVNTDFQTLLDMISSLDARVSALENK